jgi:hypothetical protein
MWRAISEKLITAALWGLLLTAVCGTAGAEEGCPPGTFPQVLEKKCVPVSQYNLLPLSDDMPMRFEALQFSMAIIEIQATGTITKDTPTEFKKFLQSDDAKLTRNILLESPGGDLMAALELGQMIRQAGMNTLIGHSVQLNGVMNFYNYKRAYCMSACAYAFLGGITRSYGGDDFYGIHRFGTLMGTISGDEAQVISSIIAKYVENMGVDLSVFEMASSASFNQSIYRVSVAMVKRMHIIYDPSGVTSFVIEQHNGKIVAAFRLKRRERDYDGVITCSNGNRLLVLFDRDNSVPTLLRAAKGFPVEFSAPGRTLSGTATYVAAESSNHAPAAMVFSLPNMDEGAFSGAGMTLTTINNPTLRPITQKADGSTEINHALAGQFMWFDAVSAFTFSIMAVNAEQTLPIVFRDCAPRASD